MMTAARSILLLQLAPSLLPPHRRDASTMFNALVKCLLLVQLALQSLAWTAVPSNPYRLTSAPRGAYAQVTKGGAGIGRVTATNSFLTMMAPPAAAFEWKPFKKGIDDKMGKCVDSTQNQFNSIRAGGANPSLLDRIFVDDFGVPTPLNQVARVAASGSQQLVVEPFDKTLLKEIEKAITTSDINITPVNDGSGMIRLNIPPLTEDRRKELAKQVIIPSSTQLKHTL